jgi:hypothetical protein
MADLIGMDLNQRHKVGLAHKFVLQFDYAHIDFGLMVCVWAIRQTEIRTRDNRVVPGVPA